MLKGQGFYLTSFFSLFTFFFTANCDDDLYRFFLEKVCFVCACVCVCFDTRNKQTNKQMHRKKIDNKICLDNDDDDEGVIMNGIE